jgi:hypothetical protein
MHDLHPSVPLCALYGKTSMIALNEIKMIQLQNLDNIVTQIGMCCHTIWNADWTGAGSAGTRCPQQ